MQNPQIHNVAPLRQQKSNYIIKLQLNKVK